MLPSGFIDAFCPKNLILQLEYHYDYKKNNMTYLMKKTQPTSEVDFFTSEHLRKIKMI